MADEDLERQKLSWEKTKFFVTGAAGFIFFVIGLWQFNLTSRNDVAKPLLQKQLDLCIEASGAAAVLAQTPTDDSLPNRPRTTFLGLYFGRLAVVEDRCLYQSMVKFKNGVLDGQVRGHDASRAAISIAFACRRLLIKNWNAGLVSIYDPQHLTANFNNLDDFQDSMNEIDGCKDSQ